MPRLDPDLLWESVVPCPACGRRSSLVLQLSKGSGHDVASLTEEEPAIGEIPPGSRIMTEDTGAGRRWIIPPKPGGNSFLTFACIWLAITGAAFAVCLIKGVPAAALAIVGALLLMGLVALLAVLGYTRTHHTLECDGVEIIHTRRCLGLTKPKVVPRDAVRDVRPVVFATENARQYRGMVIETERGKISLNAFLTPQEEDWLYRDLQCALGLRFPSRFGEPDLPPTSELRQGDGKSRLHVKASSDSVRIQVLPGKLGMIFMITGAAMLGAAAFLCYRFKDHFGLFDSGDDFAVFRSFSLVFTAMGGAMLLLGVACAWTFMVIGWRMSRTVKHIHATPSRLEVITTRGTHTSQQSWPVSDVQSLSVDEVLQKNGNPVYQASIVLPDRVVGFGVGVEHRDLLRALALLCRVIHPARR